MAPGGAGGAESGGGVVLVPGSRHRPHLHRRSGPGTGIPAPRSRLLVAPSAGGGRSEDLRVGGRSERGRRVTAARCAAGRPVAADPVSRRRPAGAVGPTNNGSAGEKGLLCQRPCRWRSAATFGAATRAAPRSIPTIHARTGAVLNAILIRPPAGLRRVGLRCCHAGIFTSPSLCPRNS